MRLDQKIVVMRRDLSRSRAQDMIKEGLVQVNGQTITKSSYAITEEDEIVIFEADMVFASRAGFKLYDVIDDDRFFHLTNAIQHFFIQRFRESCIYNGNR